KLHAQRIDNRHAFDMKSGNHAIGIITAPEPRQRTERPCPPTRTPLPVSLRTVMSLEYADRHHGPKGAGKIYPLLTEIPAFSLVFSWHSVCSFHRRGQLQNL